MPGLTSVDHVWIAQGLLASLAVGLALALVVGAVLLARPHTLFAVNARLSRWIDTRQHFRRLEQPRMVERLFYRHHRLLGALIALGAAYVLWRWAFDYDTDTLLALLGPRQAARLGWLAAALEAMLVALHVLILAVGLVILTRPSLLKRLERTANRWHRGPSVEQFDAVIGSVDRGFELYPRLSGLIVLVASAWSLVALIPVLESLLGR